ncbi:LacI family transcriptional regulator [Stackebrandtia endophytica]|uniref:LacI family transcriptional regulator n=1 Tax=Stackebrandtia endophytica TaxID=1496996 RepID=A0A543AQ84_9ACTN|nr:LacI family DNA-binding transcriptional regulator [Stackebrandtia endophytica]TQL74719.1 LacI family transcriptional regulator [Stackebrandtia endophytica]
MVSIADVAKHAGVSPTTVSHALSGKRKVGPDVHARVLAAVAELGYAPGRSAQSLASGRTRILGLIVPDIGNGYFAELAQGVEQSATLRGYNVLLCTTGFDYEREKHALEMIRSRAVDGVVYAAGAPPSTSELARLLGDLPLVLVDEEIPGAEVTAFVSDNYEGGRLAAQHLLGLGHRDVLVLEANANLISSRERVRGFTEMWSTAGAPPPHIVSGGFTHEGGHQAVAPFGQAFATGELSGLFAVNDLMALGAIDRLTDAGVDIPGDVSVLGFDDISSTRYARPRLTTIRQDVAGLGGSAVAALVTALDQDRELDPQRHVYPVELIVRDSTSAPNAHAVASADGIRPIPEEVPR